MTAASSSSRPAASPPSPPPRLGFVGVGWIGRHRMEAALKAGAAEAVAVLDTSPDAAREAATLAPGAKVVQSLDEMLALSPDGVVVATPNALHAEACVRTLEAGAHVFCQKPLGRTAAETRRILDAARRADRLVGVDLSYRHAEAMRRVRDLAQRGAVGDVYAADLVFHNAYGPDKAWFYDARLAGGGCFLDLGIHLVDAALWTLGFPRVEGVSSRLFAKGKPLAPGQDAVEDYAVARVDLDGGATVTLASSWRVSAGVDCVFGATFHGTTGSLRVQNVGGSFYDFRADLLRGTKAEPLVAPPDAWGGRALVAWAERLRGGGAGFDAAEAVEHVRVMEVLDRVYGR